MALARNRRASLLLAGAFLFVLAWRIFDSPHASSPMAAGGGVPPRAIVDGDGLRINRVRDFDYRPRHDFAVRYQEREVSISP